MSVELKNVLRIEDPSGFTYFLGSLMPRNIKELTFVPVVSKSSQAGTSASLNENEDQGYQRAGDPKRMEKIKSYVIENPDCVIPPVLLSARGKWRFHPSSANKAYGTLMAEELAAIMDGQHRLGGLWKLVSDPDAANQLKERPIPFMLVEDMSLERERNNFIDINDTQQGVKKSLLKYLNRKHTFAGEAALALMEDEDSVFVGRISIQRKEDWSLILFGAAEECVVLTFDTAFSSSTRFRPDSSPEHKTKAISFLLDYWRSVAKCMSELWSDMDLMPPINSPRTAEKPGSGPKGVGAAFLRRDIQEGIEPLIYGGGQQRNLRSGTLATPLCVGFGEAVELLSEREWTDDYIRLTELRDQLERGLNASKLKVRVNGQGAPRHPGCSNICFAGTQAEDLLAAVQPSLAASTGSACTSGIPEPSHVLRAIGLSSEDAAASVRFSVGRDTVAADIDAAVELLHRAVIDQAAEAA
jgi:DGQHR domain-containing protein